MPCKVTVGSRVTSVQDKFLRALPGTLLLSSKAAGVCRPHSGRMKSLVSRAGTVDFWVKYCRSLTAQRPQVRDKATHPQSCRKGLRAHKRTCSRSTDLGLRDLGLGVSCVASCSTQALSLRLDGKPRDFCAFKPKQKAPHFRSAGCGRGIPSRASHWAESSERRMLPWDVAYRL